LYIALGIAWLQMSPLGGYLYMSTSSMDGGDLFDLTVDIMQPKFFIQTFTIFASAKLCGTF